MTGCLINWKTWMKDTNQKDKVYYDNNCYVCSLEINTVRKRGEACGIEFIDISSPDFQEPGDYDTEMIGEFNGKQTSGAETFRKLYEKMGFKRTVRFSRLPVINSLVEVGYFIFSRWIRPILPKRS